MSVSPRLVLWKACGTERLAVGSRRHVLLGHWRDRREQTKLGGVPTLLVCEECRHCSDELAWGWRGYLVERDDDGEDVAIFFCRECVEREFRPDSNGHTPRL